MAGRLSAVPAHVTPVRPVVFACSERIRLSPRELSERFTRVEEWHEFEGWGPIPGIARAQYEVRTPVMTGSRIRVLNRDGSSHVEEVVEWLPGERLRIRMDGFTRPLARVARAFTEEWRFSSEAGTQVTRVYRIFSLEPRTAAVRPLLVLLAFFLKRAIARHMRLIRRTAA